MEDKVNVVLDGLNEEQRRAVECLEGPVLIVAGAGSGKTRVLTSRIAYILEQGVDASRVLALTFTKKAAGEMQNRVASMVGERRARRLVMGTFHSVFIRFLREYAVSLGYPERFTIYDTSDSLSAMKACIKELGLDDKIYKPKEVLSRISNAKNNLVTVGAYKANQNLLISDSHARKPRICDLYGLYQQRLKASGVMDFDDILLNMNILFKDNKQALADIASRFSYIMVDEYQDTNYSQYIILKKLAQVHHNIAVVGDDSQSIYAFRGAKIENILNFRKDWPECKVFRLERNYRSTSTIVDAANSVIAHNEGRIPKNCYSVGDEGDKIRILQAYTEQDEAYKITDEIIARTRSDKARYEDFAILYRTNSQSRALEEQLRRRNIPYMIYSGNSFFERAEIKDFMAYFKLVVNPSDNESFRRVVNKPARGIGDTTLRLIEEKALQEGTSFFAAGQSVPKVKAFCDMIAALSALVPTTDALVLANEIAEKSGLRAAYWKDESIEGLAKRANIDELFNSVSSFIEDRMEEAADSEEKGEMTVTLDDYLENVSLLSNVDVDGEDDGNKVALMTVHSAKGLEFQYVFIAGMEENLFPGNARGIALPELEEERRLFYVALTRAGKALWLSFSRTRMRNGQHESNAPSRFLREIDTKFIENPLDDGEFEESGTSFGRRSFAESGDGFGERAYSSGKGRSPYGGGGASYGGRGGYRNDYGKSSAVTYERRSPSSSGSSSPRVVQAAVPPKKVYPVLYADFKEVDMRELYAGERIEHNRFGPGLIVSLSGSYPDMKAVVRFDEHGEKLLLLLRYAKMRPEKKQ